LLLRIIIRISSNSILGIWIGLEINLISVIPIFSIERNYKNETRLILYFLIQRISSIILLISFLNINNFNQNEQFFIILFIIAIFIKIGFFPFHLWIPSVIEGLRWFNCFILTTIQKIIPLIILFSMITQKIILIFCVINRLIASIRGINQFSIRKIIRFSSINHLSLIIIRIFLSKSLFKLYLFIYIIITSIAFNYLSTLNINFIFQTINLNKTNSIFCHLNLIVIILSIAGTPPFLGFFPKIIIILKLLEYTIFIPSILILTFNVLATYFYLKVSFRIFFIILRTFKFNKIKEINNSNIFLILLTISPLIFFVWDFKLKKLLIFKIKIRI
jgi:NADH-ubiquinone oxidoreductase chain 2